MAHCQQRVTRSFKKNKTKKKNKTILAPSLSPPNRCRSSPVGTPPTKRSSGRLSQGESSAAAISSPSKPASHAQSSPYATKKKKKKTKKKQNKKTKKNEKSNNNLGTGFNQLSFSAPNAPGAIQVRRGSKNQLESQPTSSPSKQRPPEAPSSSPGPVTSKSSPRLGRAAIGDSRRATVGDVGQIRDFFATQGLDFDQMMAEQKEKVRMALNVRRLKFSFLFFPSFQDVVAQAFSPRSKLSLSGAGSSDEKTEKTPRKRFDFSRRCNKNQNKKTKKKKNTALTDKSFLTVHETHPPSRNLHLLLRHQQRKCPRLKSLKSQRRPRSLCLALPARVKLGPRARISFPSPSWATNAPT